MYVHGCKSAKAFLGVNSIEEKRGAREPANRMNRFLSFKTRDYDILKTAQNKICTFRV